MKNILVIALFAFLAGCSTQVTQITLDPEGMSPYKRFVPIPLTGLTISVRDLRPQNFLIAIAKNQKEQLQIISSATNVRQSIEQALIQGWQAKGLRLKPGKQVAIEVDIKKLVNKVNQTNLDFQAEIEMQLQVVVDTSKTRLTKQFQSTQTSTGPFKVNVFTQEKLMNRQLSDLIQQILNDSELHEAITS